MRRAHLLRPNHGAERPTLVIALDTETDSIPIGPGEVEARLRFGWLAVTRRHRGERWTPPSWHRFTTPGEAWDLIEDQVHKGWRAVLVAHNAGFDMRVIDAFHELPARGWRLHGAVIDDPPTILRWRNGRRGLLILDSLNYYRLSLAAIGSELGLPKLRMPAPTASTARWNAYCRRDVRVLLRAMLLLLGRIHDWDLGNFSPTLPAQAFTAWRHRHLSVPILIDDNPSALALARESYHGGRTEAFRLGPLDGPVRIFDVSSMYPSVMAVEPMPTVLRGVYRTVTVGELAALAAEAAVVADVTVHAETADYPTRLDDRLVFPTGRFRTVLTTPELRHAQSLGRVRAVHRVAVYDRAVIFRSFVDEWWERRAGYLASGDLASAWLCKRFMNALYGKLGQRGRVYEDVGPTDPGDVRVWAELDMDTGVIHRYRSVGGLLQELAGATEALNSHPAIAAHVTAAGRMALLALMVDAGRSFVAYVDTDSLFVTPGSPGPSEAVIERVGLGGLRLQETIETLHIFGPKDYIADGRRVTKGIRANAEQKGPNTFEQDSFVGLKGALRSGQIDKQVIRRTTKVLERTYRKGTVGVDGRVAPYHLGPPVRSRSS